MNDGFFQLVGLHQFQAPQQVGGKKPLLQALVTGVYGLNFSQNFQSSLPVLGLPGLIQLGAEPGYPFSLGRCSRRVHCWRWRSGNRAPGLSTDGGEQRQAYQAQQQGGNQQPRRPAERDPFRDGGSPSGDRGRRGCRHRRGGDTVGGVKR